MKKLSIVAALLFAFGTITFAQTAPAAAPAKATPAKTDKKAAAKTDKKMDKKSDKKMDKKADTKPADKK